MSQNEKAFFRVAALTLAVLAFQACSKGFQSASLSSAEAECSGSASCAAPLTVNPPPTTSPCIAGFPCLNTPNYAALALSIAQIMQVAISNFPGISTLASCETKSACTGAGPSSQTITANCSPSGTNLTGSTLVTFNGGQCSAYNSSDIVVAPNLNLSLAGQTIQISSTAAADYTGPVYVGGIEVAYSITTASGSINNHGLHITGSGAVPIDITTHTSTPFSATVNPFALTANVTGGTIVMADKLGNYTATLVANNLAFASGCACPVSGSLSGNLSGAASGTIALTFNATCGSITTTVNGVSSTATSPGCTPL
ncbi:MAG: hypothetical protein ACXVA9_09410 [Bdellovibrionales bacterium]